MENIISGNIRVQLLNDEIIRVELKKNGEFCDENTFFIPDKGQYSDTRVTFSQEESVICFGDYELYIPENAKSLTGVRLEKCGKRVYTYKKLKNSGELPALDKTPEVFAVSDTPRIIIPEGGYSKDRKGEYKITENVQDIYLILCGKDYKKLRSLYVELTGRCEFVRLSTLGGWNSKYYAYNEEEAKKLILDYEANNVPLDVMVIDTDWRSCEDGWGYDVNEKLFPDIKRFLDFAHAHGVEVMFNDHPEPDKGANVFAPNEIEYRERNLQALMEKGLDIWWYDRNWHTRLISPTENVRWDTFGLYLFVDVTRHYYQKVARDTEIYRRPVIMGNVIHIANGVYSSIMDSASHRYSIQWTGDIFYTAESLAWEVNNLIKCSENCIPYVNSDCGGHLGNPDKDLFIRWMQFGTLSPVFRPHCTCTVKRWRDPWAYDEETLDIVREYNNLRYRLLPVIYKNAYESYRTGAPIFRSLGWNYPRDKKAFKYRNEYMLGDGLLISTMSGVIQKPLKAGDYVAPVTATFYNGRELQGEPIAQAQWKVLNMDLNHTSPLDGVPVYDFSARFKTTVKFNRNVRLAITCDDGATVYVDGKKVFEDKTLHSAMIFALCDIEDNNAHDIEIEYFQAGGEANCALFAGDLIQSDENEAYLPAGKWLDAFDGKIYYKGKNLKKYDLRSMPLFIRLGSLIPLAYTAKNTKEQKWDRLVFDFYPDKDSRDEGYLYEDDTETTAYKLGQFRTSAYEAYYCKESNAYVVKLSAAQGGFKGEKCFKNREITVKYHVLDAEAVKSVTVNGKQTAFTENKKNAAAFPLNTCADAPDGDTVCVRVKADTSEGYEIKFYL